MEEHGRGRSEHAVLIAELTRRGFLERAGVLGLGAVIASAVPVAKQLVDAQPAFADVSLTDATMQAFADTMVPGRRVTRTALGNEVHPQAIAGVDPLPGAVEADSLALYHHVLTGFDALEPPFLADLQARSLSQGGDFLSLSFDQRVQVAISGLSFANGDERLLWEAAAAVPFTAFCAAALIVNATSAEAVGYAVMGLPGAAPKGYTDFSYRRVLSSERTKNGYLP
jgi:hypothetical protein